MQDAAAALRERTSEGLAGTGLEAGLTGEAAIKLDDRDAHSTAEKTVGVATIGLILLLLTATFRSSVAALLPVASIALVFVTAGSLIALAADGLGFDVSPDLPPLLTVVLFGIGTDYVLFTLFRYRERLRAGTSGTAAVVDATARVGRVITFAALVVVVAFSALGLSQLGSLRTMAPGLVIGVLLMWLAGITLVPAVLSLLGPHAFWLSRSWQRAPRAPVYRRLGATIARRPGRVALASTAALLALAAGTALFAADLARFVAALWRIDSEDGPTPGPHNFSRGVPLAERDGPTRAAIATLKATSDAAWATAVWAEALQAPEWQRPPTWIQVTSTLRTSCSSMGG